MFPLYLTNLKISLKFFSRGGFHKLIHFLESHAIQDLKIMLYTPPEHSDFIE